MNIDRLLARAVEIQSIPAPTFHEGQRAEYVHNEFVSQGSKPVEMDAAGNVYALAREGPGPPLVVTAHIDAVFPPAMIEPAVRHGDRIIGPGIGDNAIGVAALLELGADLRDEPGQSVWLVANVAEEGLGNLLGMQHVVERFGDRVIGYLALEGMSLGHLYHRGLPARRFRITVETRGGHAWVHAGRDSAVHELVRLADRMLREIQPGDGASFNLGRIEGGTSVNTIADRASLEIDLRALSAEQLEMSVDGLHRIVQAYSSDQGRIRMDLIGSRPAGEISVEHRLVQAAIAAAVGTGLSPPALESGSTDASLPLSLGLPAICVGVTRGGDAHSASEFIEISPLTAGYQALLELCRLVTASDE